MVGVAQRLLEVHVVVELEGDLVLMLSVVCGCLAKHVDDVTTLNRLLNAVGIVDLDADTARAYGDIRAHLYSIGKPIGPNELWIAAHARSMSLPLVTNNTREFARVPNLAIENWIDTLF